ncbi:MAG: MBOAT family protein [Treponema sp.]|jgi:alginate O-acetyltransferase complex protein AlgI|nr:MBOAT family protein [Treponema sp.]
MVFSSTIFLFFFLPPVILGYRLLKEAYRVYFLLLASLFFYTWGEPAYILIMLLSITINYLFGLAIYAVGTRSGPATKLFLAAGILSNLGVLYYFKYLNFTLSVFNLFFNTNIVNPRIVMPIGISFFTFQGMSYIIDLYRKKVALQKNPALVAFYISFFPQLIAGPIVRYIDIEQQIYSRNESIGQFVRGARRFISGLAKKVIIANTLGYTADQVFANPPAANGPATAWLGVICYSFQIYFDFSGYSDMAIGLGKMFGFEFRENFDYPYISKTLTEFWRRWHISLSSWFRDYLYIPLGGNRKGNVYINLFIVFFVTGLWHGARFSFIAWGLWHGFFLIAERLLRIREANGPFVPLRRLVTMLIVIIGWVFFRAEGLQNALKYLGVMFGLMRNISYFSWRFYLTPNTVIALVLAVIASMPVTKWRVFNCQRTAWFKYISPILIIILFFISGVFVVSSSYNPFIYFRF